MDRTDPRGAFASAHLLRTLAAVAPGARIVDLACGNGAHTEALTRLGFDVWACDESADQVDATRVRLEPLVGDTNARVTRARAGALGYPDAYAAWVVLTAAAAADLPDALAESARVLVPGGWLWAEVPAADARRLADAADVAGLVVAEARTGDDARGTVRAIYRRPGTVG